MTASERTKYVVTFLYDLNEFTYSILGSLLFLLLVFESTVFVFSDDQETMAFLRDDTYTVDEAVDAMGFGPFQFKLLAICGLFTVSTTIEAGYPWSVYRKYHNRSSLSVVCLP